MGTFHKNRRQGAALMLSLWALFLLSAMVISWAVFIGSRLILSGHANRNLEAVALACSGAEVAMHPQITPDSEALIGEFGRNKSYEAHITGEGGRLNLNWVAQPPENPARLELLRRFLEIKGIDLNERDYMIDTLLDWIDGDNLVRLNGAEDEPGYKPANRPLKRIEELRKVKGWEEFTSASDWDADLTIDSDPPSIDVAWASRDVLLTLPNVGEPLVDQFLTMRRGGDEIDGTLDDGFTSDAEAFAIFGPQLAQIQPLIHFKGFVVRVISVGKSGDVTRTVRMVLLKKSGAIQLRSWKEL